MEYIKIRPLVCNHFILNRCLNRLRRYRGGKGKGGVVRYRAGCDLVFGLELGPEVTSATTPGQTRSPTPRDAATCDRDGGVKC